MNSRPKIVICSLFKTVDDPRMYEKLACTLVKPDLYEVIVIGNNESNIPDDKKINFYPIFKLKRLSLLRVFMPLKLGALLIKLKPDIIINNSVDFLLIISIYSFFTRSKFIYDVQENYYYNIRYNQYFPKNIKLLLASSVRMIELIASAFIDYYLLAEKTYKTELPFIKKGNFSILENKYVEIPGQNSVSRQQPGKDLKILFSGTIAEHYGIFEILDFIIEFHKHNNNISFNIIGYCAHAKTYSKLLQVIQDFNYIQIQGGNHKVPHHEIIRAIRESDFAIINYHINASTEYRIPTRLFEYLANKLPVLIQNHKPWSEIVEKADGGICIDFKSLDYDHLYNAMITRTFYLKNEPQDIYWKSEEAKFLEIIVKQISLKQSIN